MASKRRSSRRSSTSGSGPAIVAIVALGAAGWWTASEGKHPDFSRFLSQFSSPKGTEKGSAKPKEAAAPIRPKENVAKASPTATPKGDAPRPLLPVRPATPTPRETSTPSLREARQIAVVRPPAPVKAPETKSAVANIPVGRPQPGTTPTIIYARDRTVIHQNAWEKAAAIGTVERGREMRSYGKTGKWHRVVVPSTNMIGWVHEDRLAASKPSWFFTGSISK